MSRANKTEKNQVHGVEESLDAWNAYRGASMADKYYGIIVNHLPTFGGMELVEETPNNYLYCGSNGYTVSIFKALTSQLRQVKVIPQMGPGISAWTFFLDSQDEISFVLKSDIANKFTWTTSSVEDFQSFDAEYKKIVQVFEDSFLMSNVRNSETNDKRVF